MRFGLFYEHQLPKPWAPDDEHRLYREALEQVEIADRVGLDHVWEVEHHFLEEYSHSSAPEVFLAACSQRTRRIRLGHGIALMPPAYNHPARVAERIATLDLVSDGRVEWGTGESASLIEMEGFGIAPSEKTAMWQEATEQAANMMAMHPYPGFKGRYLDMPCRNVVPKPLQRPHPPAWVACSKRETIHRAARHGLGALAFAFVEPEMAARWVAEYYDIIRSDACVPLTHTVNPNVALVSGMMCHPDADEAVARGLDGFKFFGYALGWFGIYGEIKPGHTDIWSAYQAVRDRLPDNAGRGGIGTPEQIRAHLRRYEEAGVDQIIFVKQSGRNRHDHICESLELFGAEVLPEFAARDAVRQVEKDRALAPYVAAALARKPRLAPLAPAEVPVYLAPGRQRPEIGAAAGRLYADRSLPIPTSDPSAADGRGSA